MHRTSTGTRSVHARSRAASRVGSHVLVVHNPLGWERESTTKPEFAVAMSAALAGTAMPSSSTSVDFFFCSCERVDFYSLEHFRIVVKRCSLYFELHFRTVKLFDYL